jgi:anthranilate phosphoribosyltransferase
LGVGRAELRPLLAEALTKLGTRRTLVVHGADRLDEVTLADVTKVTEAAGTQLREFEWTAADFGLPPAGRETMQVDGPRQSAEIIRAILDGHPGPPRDIVVANAAAALWTVGRSESLRECARLAAKAIDNGAARDLLARLAERTRP